MAIVQVSLKEHNIYNDGSHPPDITFSKLDATTVRSLSTVDSRGKGWIFYTIPVSFFQNNDIVQVRVKCSGNIGLDVGLFDILDGSYDRSSDVDFPVGAVRLAKGNGIIESNPFPGNGAWYNKEFTITVAEYAEDNLTIFVGHKDYYWGLWDGVDCDWIKVIRGGETILNLEMDGTIVMESTGGHTDYGYCLTNDNIISAISSATPPALALAGTMFF